MEASPTATAAADILRLDGVSKSFGDRQAVRNVSFAVPVGEVCGLLGPNGAGKTTLFRLLMGLLRPTGGEIRIGGLDAFADRVETKRLVGFVPDEPIFYSYLSGRETLELSASMHGLDPAATLERLHPLIERLRLVEQLPLYADDYSRGTKKKLALVLALLHRPRLLILDEPTNGLDVEATRLFDRLVLEQAASGTTVLFSTHVMDHVARLCSRVVVIDEGAVVADGSLDRLREEAGCVDLDDLFLRLIGRPDLA